MNVVGSENAYKWITIENRTFGSTRVPVGPCGYQREPGRLADIPIHRAVDLSIPLTIEVIIRSGCTTSAGYWARRCCRWPTCRTRLASASPACCATARSGPASSPPGRLLTTAAG